MWVQVAASLGVVVKAWRSPGPRSSVSGRQVQRKALLPSGDSSRVGDVARRLEPRWEPSGFLSLCSLGRRTDSSCGCREGRRLSPSLQVASPGAGRLPGRRAFSESARP